MRLVAQHAVGPGVREGVMGKVFSHAEKRKIWEQPGSVGYEIAELPEFTLVELTIEDLIPAHAVPFDMLFYLIAGAGVCIQDGTEFELRSGDCVHIDRGISRGWRNTGSEPLRLLAIRRP